MCHAIYKSIGSRRSMKGRECRDCYIIRTYWENYGCLAVASFMYEETRSRRIGFEAASFSATLNP